MRLVRFLFALKPYDGGEYIDRRMMAWLSILAFAVSWLFPVYGHFVREWWRYWFEF